MSDQNINLKSHLMDYVMPNPVFVMEQEKRSKYLHQVGNQLESVSKLFNHFADMGEKLCSTLADIFSELREVPIISTDAKYVPLTKSFRSTTLALRSHFLEINETIVQPLQEFVKVDLKNLKDSRKQYEHCSAVYDAAVEKHVSGFQKHFSIGSSSNIIPQILHPNQQPDAKDVGLVQSHQQVTEAFFDFTSQMTFIEEKLKFVLPNLFISYLSLFETNFSTCLKDVSDRSSEFTKIKADADEANKVSQKQAQDDVKDKKQLNTFLPKFWNYVISIENKNVNSSNKNEPIKIGFTNNVSSDSSIESNEEINDTNNPFDDFIYRTDIKARNSNSMQGFLWKKCKFNWKKRFFICNNGLLSYGKTIEATLKSPKEIDLLLCAAKVESNQQRRNCFTVRTPDRKFELQALTTYEMNLWMSVILKNIIAKASNAGVDKNEYNKQSKQRNSNIPLASTKSKSKNSNKQSENSKLHHHNQNQNQDQHKHQNDENRSVTVCPSKNICADCGARGAFWVSITWGVTLCTQCAGVHRSLSTSVSFVRSIELDDITPAQIMIVDSIGSKRANLLLEGKLNMKEERKKKKKEEAKQRKEAKNDDDDDDDNQHKHKKNENNEDNDYSSSTYSDEDEDENEDDSSVTKIRPDANSQKRSLFIQQKYKSLAFVKMPKSKTVPDVFDSIKKQSLIDVYNGLIYSKSKNSVPFIKGFTPLHASVCIGNPVILEFVLLQLPDYLNKIDDRGWSPLSYAAYYQQMPVVAFLLESGADPDASPPNSHPWSIAKARGSSEIEILIKSFSKNAQKQKQQNENENDDDQNNKLDDDFKLPETPPHSEFGNLQSVHESTLLMEEAQQNKLKKLDTLTGNEIRETLMKFGRRNRRRDGKPIPSTFENND